VAEKARDGFHRGFVQGLAGMMLSGLSGGKVNWPGMPMPPHRRVMSVEDYFAGRIPKAEIDRLRTDCAAQGVPLHDALMERAGWPAIPYDGQLLVTHQDALLMGGKVQAPGGYADHVTFLDTRLCETCGAQTCVEMCSGEAIHAAEGGGRPLFDREKCVYCGACLWNCAQGENIAFQAGAGGLHSAVNGDSHALSHRCLWRDRARSPSNAGAGSWTGIKERDDAARRARPVGRARAV